MRRTPSEDKAAPPRATYRLQFNADFTFDHAIGILPYLARLGVSHVYASPILTARPGSTHGYDIVDVEKINPELGGEPAFRRFSEALKARGLGLILDIVPNHMGIGGSKNPWWLSVLEWGSASRHARVFDIDWERPGAEGKLVMPVLGAAYGEVLERGELKLAFDVEAGSFAIHYGEHALLLCPTTYVTILDAALDGLEETIRSSLRGPEEALAAACSDDESVRRGEELKRALAGAVKGCKPLAHAVKRAIAAHNGKVGDPRSFDALDRLIGAQHWRAAYWRVAASDINYRRFFDINLLAGVRIEEPEVFVATHSVVMRLVREGLVQGLRIDHIDGLADPASYLAELRRAVGPEIYLLVEKILEPGEELRPWPVAGTTGYDTLNLIDGVLLDRRSREAFVALYRKASGGAASYEDELAAAKRLIVEKSFAGELESLVGDLKFIADCDRHSRDLTKNAIRSALVEIIVAYPVYRSYLDEGRIVEADRQLLGKAVATAKEASELANTAVHDLALAVLFLDVARVPAVETNQRVAKRFRRRFQQLTGPVMAKSLEDTLFYRYVPLLALNEVGGDPSAFGVAKDEFHAIMKRRAVDWPHSMIATATHDTKRGEDARARLIAITEDADGWTAAVAAFERLAAPLTRSVKGREAPDAVDRLLLFQSVLGAWPLALLEDRGLRDDEVEAFWSRMLEFASKALREAKRHTSWMKPNAAYEQAVAAFLEGLLQEEAPFLSTFRPLARRLAHLGMLNALSRTVLKFTLPGVPDIFQGTELWDFSLVDPDNRRPVDYASRIDRLDEAPDPGGLLADWRQGSIKQWLSRVLLADRAAAPKLYADGDYAPLSSDGPLDDHLLAFSRACGSQRLAALATRHPASLVADGAMPLGKEVWRDATVAISPGHWRDLFTGRLFKIRSAGLRLADVFAILPVAVLRRVHASSGAD